jgi:hypothetical protein
MAEVLIYGLPLIALIAGTFLVYYFFPAAFPPFWRHAHVPFRLLSATTSASSAP